MLHIIYTHTLTITDTKLKSYSLEDASVPTHNWYSYRQVTCSSSFVSFSTLETLHPCNYEQL